MKLEDLPINGDWELSDWSDILPKGGDDPWDISYYSGTYSVYDGSSVEDVTPDRIAHVDAWFGDSPEGYASRDFACLLELADGTWAACMAWSDTTGWDCRGDVQWKWARTREEAISQGLDRPARVRLGVHLPGEEMPA